MSESLEFILARRDHHTAAIREALKLYPDLRYEGDCLVSRHLTRDACDRVTVVRGDRGDLLRLGKQVGEVTVHCADVAWMSMPVNHFFWGLRKHHPELHAQIIKLLADSRGAL